MYVSSLLFFRVISNQRLLEIIYIEVLRHSNIYTSYYKNKTFFTIVSVDTNGVQTTTCFIVNKQESAHRTSTP